MEFALPLSDCLTLGRRRGGTWDTALCSSNGQSFRWSHSLAGRDKTVVANLKVVMRKRKCRRSPTWFMNEKERGLR